MVTAILDTNVFIRATLRCTWKPGRIRFKHFNP